MTAKQLYRAVLTELNKLEAPSILLEDFNYLANKAINLYINKKYNIYDVNLLSTDDLRVLKGSVVLTPLLSTVYKETQNNEDPESKYIMDYLFGATYEVNLPNDYLHILNCVCIYKVKKRYSCYNKDTYIPFGARRLTADMWGPIQLNLYMKPSYRNPYYYIHNVSTVQDGDSYTNPISYNDEGEYTKGTDRPFVKDVLKDSLKESATISIYKDESTTSTPNWTAIVNNSPVYLPYTVTPNYYGEGNKIEVTVNSDLIPIYKYTSFPRELRFKEPKSTSGKTTWTAYLSDPDEFTISVI